MNRRNSLPAILSGLLSVPLLLLTPLLLAACDKEEAQPTEEEARQIQVITAGEEAAAEAEEASEEPAPLTAVELHPIIRALGTQGVLPEKIVVEFSQPCVEREALRKELSDGTQLHIEPEVEGSLQFTGLSTLTFTPRKGFEPGVSYQAQLLAVETMDGVIKPDKHEQWGAYRFETPAFELLRMEAVAIHRGMAEVDLVFSAPVKAKDVKRRVSFTVGGAAPSHVSLRTGATTNLVRAKLKSHRTGEDVQVIAKLSAGLESRAPGEHEAPAISRQVKLDLENPIEIHAVKRKEGPTGHYLEVVCRDHAAEGGYHYYYEEDEGDWYRVSSRCLLTDQDAAEGIHLDPPLATYIVPSRSGFNIMGDFERGSYSLRIDAGSASVDGGHLPGTYSASFTVPARSPKVSFKSKGRYLPRRSWKNLAIQHLNLSRAELAIRQVRPENLVFWMSGQDEAATARTSDLILKQSIALQSEPDEQTSSWLDLGALLPEKAQGIFEVTLSSGGAKDTSRLLLTDLNLVAKRSLAKPDASWDREVLTWVLDTHTAQPRTGAEVRLIRPSGYTVARCTTGSDGGCTLKIPKEDVDETPPFAIVASHGKDLTYLKFGELKTELAEERVHGESYFAQQPYRAAPYSDRGVYRPGDTAHFAAIIRSEQGVAPPAGMPVQLELLDPRNNVTKERVLKTNAAGLVAYDFHFEAFARTGKYTALLKTGDQKIGSYAFNVEEFVPERMKVEAEGTKDGAASPEQAPIQVTARYLFGGSAAGSQVELNCELRPTVFTPQKNSNYQYGTWQPRSQAPKALSLGSALGKLDDEGQALMRCPSLGEGTSRFQGAARLAAEVAVFEAGSGRTTRAEASVPIHPEKYYLGLQSGTQKVEAGKVFTVQGLAVDWRGESYQALDEVQVELFRLESEYNWWWAEGEERYERFLRPVGEGELKAQVDKGRFSFQVTPSTDSAGYLVRVKAGNAQTDLQLEGHGRRYWWRPEESRADMTPRPLKPTSIELQLPDAIEVGEKATVRFDAPYRGRALLTVETSQVLASHWMDVEAGPQQWSFQLDEFTPNVYVAAFVIKDPYLDTQGAFLPDRAFGVGSVKVKPSAFTHQLKMQVPDEVRSNSILKVQLDLGPQAKGAVATVAAVDEGILSLTRFPNPDPHADIFVRRALGVESFETVGWTLLLPPAGPSSSTGGDGEGGGPGRVQPVKPVALWSGVLEVPESGKLTVKLDVPTYRGELRVMAVTADAKRMGTAVASVPVRDPIVLQTTLPRFLTQGDKAEVPVFVTNLSGKQREVEISLAAENLPVPGLDLGKEPPAPIQFLGEKQATVKLADGASQTVVFQVQGSASVGAAKLRVTAKARAAGAQKWAGNLQSYEELEVPFAPTGIRTRKVTKLELEPGLVDLAPHLAGWTPTTEQSSFWVTTNPFGEAFDHLKYLVRYPYGCIEQTTSTTRPLLYVRNLLNSVDPTLVAKASVEEKVAHGVDRILAMQTPSGGFSYWPGGTSPNYWGTAYATHMLLDARDAGYEVQEERLADALNFIAEELANNTDEDDTVHGNAFRYGEAYLHYVLARAGKGRAARIQRLVESYEHASDSEDRERLYLLKAALWLTGDRRYEKDLRQLDTTPLTQERRNSWSYYSDLRRRGFTMSVYQDLFGADTASEPMAQLVANGLMTRRSRYYTTQELVWGVTALGKWLQGKASSFEQPSLLVDGKKSQAQPKAANDKTSDVTWSLARASEVESLQLELPGELDGKVYLIISSQGVRTDEPPVYGGNGVQLTRSYLNADGRPIDTATGGHGLGDMVYVRLRISNQQSENIANLALTDRLPAGWEIENPRLGRGTLPDWADEDKRWSADYLNVRDDRVEVFGTLPARKTVEVVYAARAVTAGSFNGPSAEVEAMYDPEVWARVPGQTIVISGPWEDFLL